FSFPAMLFIALVLAAGILGPRTPDNLAPYLTWSVWWVFIIFVVALIGNLGGIACPWENVAFWIARHLPNRRLLSLERPWPRRFHNVWLAAIFFLSFVWLDLVTRLSLSPVWTVSFWIIMLLAATAGMLIF